MFKEQLAAARRYRIPGLPLRWQQFGVCILFHFGMPLAPLAVEWFKDGKISPGTLTVGSAVYVMVIGNSSRNLVLFGISLTLGFLYTLMFGMLPAITGPALERSRDIIFWSIAIFALFHLIERFNRHVMDRAPYWEFANREEEKS